MSFAMKFTSIFLHAKVRNIRGIIADYVN